MTAIPVYADGQETLRVVAQVPAKTYYVGQAIELRIGAEAEGERPEVEPPVIPETDVSLIGTSLSPVAASGIGDRVAERNLFITRFRLVPRRPGMLQVPPVRVRLGARSGASSPLRVDVRRLPLSGRPPEFLGGVGGFAVEAKAQPSTVRTGQGLTYTIRVTGPAARGMTTAPDLARFAQVPLGLEVEPLPNEAEDNPPSRWFRYRIRPTRAGAASLPPVSIAAFDPTTSRYVTKVTPSVPIRVVAIPEFDPATLDYQLSSTSVTPRRPLLPGGRATTFLAMLAIAGLLLSTLVARAFLSLRTIDPRRCLLRDARRLDVRLGAEQAARHIQEILAEFLERTTGRPRGVLTPEEARSEIARATQYADLGARSARLIFDCDRARYSNREPDVAELVSNARQLFEEIGRRRNR